MAAACPKPASSAQAAQSRTHARAHSVRRAQGIRRQRFCRRARGCHCAARGHQQADALPLFRQQGTFVPRSAAPENGRAAGLGRNACRATRRKASPSGSKPRARTPTGSACWNGRRCRTADKRLIDEKNRRAATARGLERIRQRQARGQISAEFDPRHVMLAMRSLTMFPAAFPAIDPAHHGPAGFRSPIPEGARGIFEKICGGFPADAGSRRVKINFAK